MATSEDGSGCLVSRARSQSDPSVLTDSTTTSSADAGENPGNGAGRGRPGSGGGRGQTVRGAHPRRCSASPPAFGSLRRTGAPAPRFTSPVRNVAGAPRSPLSGYEPISWVEPGTEHRPSLSAGGQCCPRGGFPSLGADQQGEESQTCGRLRLCWPGALPPSPSSARVAQWPCPAGAALLGPPGRGASSGRPTGAGHLGAPPASPDRCAPQAASREMKGVCRTEPDFIDFVHFSTPAVASIV